MRKRCAFSRTSWPTSMPLAFLSVKEVTAWTWCRLFCTCESTISWLPCCSRNSRRTRHLVTVTVRVTVRVRVRVRVRVSYP